MSTQTSQKTQQRIRRHGRVRARVIGTPERPRLAVYKSNTRLSAQLIDDTAGVTIAAISTAHVKGKDSKERLVAAANAIAEAAKGKGVSKVVFDRGGFLYTGIIKEFADAVRAAGLEF